MTNNSDYKPPKVWTWKSKNGGTFASINRPIAGATHDKPLPVGKHPFQLYSLATPNGVKITVMLEELLQMNVHDAEYDAWLIKIRDGDQFSSGFVAANPNSKIPVLVDHSLSSPIRVFESGNILLYLAEKFGAFLPENKSRICSLYISSIDASTLNSFVPGTVSLDILPKISRKALGIMPTSAPYPIME